MKKIFISFFALFLFSFLFSQEQKLSKELTKKQKEIESEINKAIALIDKNIDEAKNILENTLKDYFKKDIKPISPKKLLKILYKMRKKRYTPKKLTPKFKPYNELLFTIYKTLGEIYLKKNKPLYAISYLKNAFSYKQDGEILYKIALSYKFIEKKSYFYNLKVKDFEEAYQMILDLATRILTKNNDTAKIFSFLGDSFASYKRHNLAIYSYKQFLLHNSSPKNLEIYKKLAKEYILIGKPYYAKSYYEKIFKKEDLYKETSLLYSYIYCLIHTNEPQKAIEILDNLLKKEISDKEKIYTLYYKIKIYSDILENYEQAITTYKKLQKYSEKKLKKALSFTELCATYYRIYKAYSQKNQKKEKKLILQKAINNNCDLNLF
jgi:tetratricopeptide (TPR) repeat protein